MFVLKLYWGMQAAAKQFLSDLSRGAAQALVVWSASSGPQPACPSCSCDCSPTYSVVCPSIDGPHALQVVTAWASHFAFFLLGLLVGVFVIPALWSWRAQAYRGHGQVLPKPPPAATVAPTAEEIRALASQQARAAIQNATAR